MHMGRPNFHSGTGESAGPCHGDDCQKKDVILNVDAATKAQRSTSLRVPQMDCADEVAAVEQAFKGMTGVATVQVKLMNKSVAVSHADSVTPDHLVARLKRQGLAASLLESDSSPDHVDNESQKPRLIAVALSGVLTGVGLLLQWSDVKPDALRIAVFLGAIISGGWFIAPKAFRAVRRLALDMNVLMTVAVIGAAAIGEWSEGAAVVFLFALSELLEAVSLSRARRAVQTLLKLTPEVALVKRGNDYAEVPVEHVAIGEQIAIKSGAKIPLDGKVIAGVSSINQAPITGESMPVEKAVGDPVFAGTINGDGNLEILVLKGHTDTTLA